MPRYREILKEHPSVRLLDGHLVDIQGTLIIGGKLNEPLYKSMLKAYEAGEKIYIMSSLPDKRSLEKAGVDTDKFMVLPKSQFRADFVDPPYTIVTGKIVDDTPPIQQGMFIIQTDEKDGYIGPDQEEYSFKRTDMPEDLASYYNGYIKNKIDQVRKAINSEQSQPRIRLRRTTKIFDKFYPQQQKE